MFNLGDLVHIRTDFEDPEYEIPFKSGLSLDTKMEYAGNAVKLSSPLDDGINPDDGSQRWYVYSNNYWWRECWFQEWVDEQTLDSSFECDWNDKSWEGVVCSTSEK